VKINFILPVADLSGGVRVVATHARGLRQRGHDVMIVYPPPKQLSLREKARTIKSGAGWPRTRRQGPSHLDSGEIPTRILESWRPVMNHDLPDADVTIATWWETAEWMMRLSPRKGEKIHFIQGDDRDAVRHDDHLVARVEAAWRDKTSKIAVSKWVEEKIRMIVPSQKIEIVPNGVDLGIFNAGKRARQTRPTIGFIYSTAPYKGTDSLLNAIELIRTRMPTLRIVCFGAEKPLDKLPLPRCTEFEYCPPQSSIKTIYAKCDAWLFGSRAEGFGLPILEAMACRTPVIATPTGAAPYLLVDGGGLLVKTESPQDIADAFAQICGLSLAHWQEMSAAAHRTASRHTWEQSTHLFENALAAVIAQTVPAKLAEVPL
jgi:glycosyltransferase involved in cell wall biosynthesis